VHDLDRSGAFVSMSLNAKGGCGRLDGESERSWRPVVAIGANRNRRTAWTQGACALRRALPIVARWSQRRFSAKDHVSDAGSTRTDAPRDAARPQPCKCRGPGRGVLSRVAWAKTGGGVHRKLCRPLKAAIRWYWTGRRRSAAAVGGPLAVRRLTPRECERLQGCRRITR